MIFNLFGFLASESRKAEQLPNKEKSQKRIQVLKMDHGRRSILNLKESKKRERNSSFTHQHR